MKAFIVPHDFSDVADNALSHAITTAKFLDAQVFVLHVVEKQKEINEAEKKLSALVKPFENLVTITPKVRVGNIFEDIGEFAAEHHAEMIFMGTHGTHGWQHLTGSNALKVVTNSSVPFVIVQKSEIKETGYDDIVVPLDLHKETKQKLAVVADLAMYFKSRVHVVTPDETDEFLRRKVQANIQFAKKFCKERNIEMTATLANPHGFDKEVVKLAIQTDSDLIAIMNLNKNNLFGVLTASYEQYIINNDAQIPTLIVNPVDSPYGKSVLFS
ncbi:MAG: nucleotide-binding universal stress UspA family protein [Psychromonas sp.]|jgi:nucleotide-binding universal stress UspA family protein